LIASIPSSPGKYANLRLYPTSLDMVQHDAQIVDDDLLKSIKHIPQLIIYRTSGKSITTSPFLLNINKEAQEATSGFRQSPAPFYGLLLE
jgi:hypothetical protein